MSHKTHLLFGLLAIALAPFAAWGLVVMAAQVWGPRLRRILPCLSILSWGVWGVGQLVATIAIFSRDHFWLAPFGIIAASSGFIFGKVERWVKRRYDPELLPPQGF